ncbi:MAG: chloride channel protein, partial [Bacteroidota bacterium]|nr:chloride channel protein [Bacteroidota bacterium]
MKITRIQQQILRAIRGIRQRQLMLGLSVIIGLLAGTAAVLLKNLTHFVERESKSWLLGDQSSELSYLLPLGGIMLTMLFVKYLLKQDIGHGISKILFAISKRKGHLKSHNTWSSMLASSL